MVTPEVMEQLKNGFWETVLDCLVEFHDMPREKAEAKVREFRPILDWGDASPFVPDLIYHAEPFSLANDFAQRKLDIGDFREAYFRIRDRRVGRSSGIVVTESPVRAASWGSPT